VNMARHTVITMKKDDERHNSRRGGLVEMSPRVPTRN
jgi:hypothetical protein